MTSETTKKNKLTKKGVYLYLAGASVLWLVVIFIFWKLLVPETFLSWSFFIVSAILSSIMLFWVGLLVAFIMIDKHNLHKKKQ